MWLGGLSLGKLNDVVMYMEVATNKNLKMEKLHAIIYPDIEIVKRLHRDWWW